MLIAYRSEMRFGPGFTWPKQKPRSVGDSLAAYIFMQFENAGLSTIPRSSISEEVLIDDKVIMSVPPEDFDRPLGPGESVTSWIQFTRLGSFLNKPGRYEVRYQVWLPKGLGETNLDNNVLVQYVDVVEE